MIFDAWITPRDHRSICLERRKGIFTRVDLRDARAQIIGHGTAVSAVIVMTPRDHRPICLERREASISRVDLRDFNSK